MRRACLLILVFGAAAFFVAAPASAGNSTAEARAEVAQAGVMLDRSLALVKAGDRKSAYDVARSAYLDHYERAEVALRLRDPNLVLDTEFEFADLRDQIESGKPVSEIETTAARIREHLRDTDRVLAKPGIAAPALAFLFSFSILFREGVEVVLLIAILLGALEAGRAQAYRKPLAVGVGAAAAASVVTWLLAVLVIDIAPVQRELLEAGTALLAVVVLFFVTFWLVSQLEHRRRMEFMRARIAGAISAGSAAAFAGLGFTAVYREGFETALFYQALLLFAEGLWTWVALGVAAAAVALVGVGYAILKLGKTMPLKPMLMTGASMLLLLSVAFVGNAVRSLQEGGHFPLTPIAGGWARLPIFLAELTGIHPTREGIAVQAALLGVYVLGALYVFAWQPTRRRRLATQPS